MNRKLLSLGIFLLLGAGCTLPTEDDLTDLALNKLNIDKDTALAYTEIAMKQAAMASSAITAEAPKGSAEASARFSPLHKGAYQKFSVTADACVVYSDEMCNEDGTKCSYTEDYNACGTDFKGKIVRTFEGDFETYKVTVDFDAYTEKAPADPLHYAYTGKSVMSGTIGISSASLSVHVEGTSSSNIAGKLFSIKSSSDMTFVFLNNALTVNGTQAGTIVESGQTGSISITELKYEDTCKEGPSGGTVKTTIDGKESVTVITGCGKGTITVNGEAHEIGADQINSTFSPGTGNKDESGFAGIIEGTDGGSLLSGDWFVDTGTLFGNLSFYEYDGITHVFYNVSSDTDADGNFYGVGDEFLNGDGELTIVNGKAEIAWNNYFEGSYDIGEYGPEPVFTVEHYDNGTPLVKTYDFDLSGNGLLVFDGLSFTKFAAEYNEPIENEVIENPLNGFWVYSNLPGEYESVSLFDDGYGYAWIVWSVDSVGVNSTVQEDGDTLEEKSGPYTVSGTYSEGAITPTWEQTWVLTYDYTLGHTWENTSTTPVVDSPIGISLNEQADFDPMNDTLYFNAKTFSRQ